MIGPLLHVSQRARRKSKITHLQGESRHQNPLPAARPDNSLHHSRLLDLMIARGWGSTPRLRIPANWRDSFGPDAQSPFARKMRQEMGIE